MKMKKTILLPLAFFLLLLSSCKKTSGEGGFATLKGKVFIKDYDASFTILNAEYYGQGETVYIIYGNDPGVGNSVKTSYDGTFVFEFLRKGKYKVYVLSKDPSVPAASKTKEIAADVEITKKKQTIELIDLVILK